MKNNPKKYFFHYRGEYIYVDKVVSFQRDSTFTIDASFKKFFFLDFLYKFFSFFFTDD